MTVLCAGSLLLGGGCGSAAQEDREGRDALVRKARALKNAQNFEGAEEAYVKALERKPYLARAHLELGLLYDQHLNDDLRAIYHYQRYLEMRPDAEKRETVEELIRWAKISFAATLPDQSSDAVREIGMLKREIEELKAQLAKRDAAAGTPPQPPAGASTSAGAGARREATVSAVTTQATTHVVQSGDTLRKIAGKYYHDTTKWELILNANRAALPDEQKMNVGQTLTIPAP